jgi:hypothetical protein
MRSPCKRADGTWPLARIAMYRTDEPDTTKNTGPRLQSNIGKIDDAVTAHRNPGTVANTYA